MNTNILNLAKTAKLAFSILAISLLFASCSDKIEVNPVDESDYNNVINIYGSLLDVNSMKSENIVELEDNDYTTKICFSLPRVAGTDVNVEVSYDDTFVEIYNASNGTSFITFPQDAYKLQNDGVITLVSEEKNSNSLELVLSTPNATGNYILPLIAKVSSDNPEVDGEEIRLNYFVKAIHEECGEGEKPLLNTAFKGEDAVKNFLFFEVNDTNPLNALEFRREDGAYLFDYVVLFAANINYNHELGEVYVSCNPNVQFLLDNNEEYIQPLRKHGIKVLLGLLGNHDEAGLAQLSEIGAKSFASKLAAICDAYNLDGVNFDDEYSESPDLSNPLFTKRSRQAGARLTYETKQLMPEKDVTVFAYGNMYGVDEVDGVPAGDWIDIAIADYGSYARPLKGMTKKNCTGMSTEFARWGRISEYSARRVKEEGYGYAMQFALWASGKLGSQSQINSLNNLSKGLYDMPLMPVTGCYKKGSTQRYLFR